MTEEELAKTISKFLIENRTRNLTDKELLKAAVEPKLTGAVVMMAGMRK